MVHVFTRRAITRSKFSVCSALFLEDRIFLPFQRNISVLEKIFLTSHGMIYLFLS